MNKKEITTKAFKDSLPVMMGYLTMGFAAGVLLAVKVGLPCSPVWGFVMALSIISGTMQFAIVQPLADCASIGTVALMTLLINFRYVFYGFTMLERWRGVPILHKLLLIGALADETYALQAACKLKHRKENLLYCSLVALFDTSYWTIGVTSGAALGSAFSFPAKGIEFTMAALFLVILTDQVHDMVKARRTK